MIAFSLPPGPKRSVALGLAGDAAPGVHGAVEWLKEYNQGRKVDIGRRVAVIGGGNSAVDAARTAVRMGADGVTIYYRRGRKEMPALAAEICAAEQEGVRIEELAAPTAILLEKGRVSGLALCRMALKQFDRSGRRRPEPIPNSGFWVQVDMIIAAIGQRADLEFIPVHSDIAAEKGSISVDPALKTANDRVWAGGDVVTGPAMVIDAIRAGQEAARAIDEKIRAARGEPPWVPLQDAIEIPFEVDEDPAEQPQTLMPELALSKRTDNFDEVETGYTEAMALAEARRCLRCDAKEQNVRYISTQV